MSHLPFTLLAYFLNALAVLANKFLLSNIIPDPLVYIFYISLASLLAIVALPFTRVPGLEVFTLASVSTLLWTTGAYFMYKALKIGAVSRVIPIIGTLIPLILLIFASETRSITLPQTWAIWTLIVGMLFLTLPDWRLKLTAGEIIFEVLSAGFFAVSYIILRQAYLQFDFFSVLVWSRLILLPLTIIMVAIPTLRSKIINSSSSLSSRTRSGIHFFSKTGLIFIGGQISGAASELLILFSISLANPALVNSLQGVQYVFLLIFGFILSKKYPAIFQERYTPLVLISKAAGIALIGIGLYQLAFGG
ncbi:MAG: hypothetical protein M1142_03320 [Patescibacteria group bacterium]|nr:hypothetical protein [Patescibacteria group bacterium]